MANFNSKIINFAIFSPQWYIGEICEAVGIWYEMEVFVRSQENGLSQALGFGICPQ